jgi:O-antigen/teichoic acid export membrane protein
MKIPIPTNREELKQHLKDPLYKNAYFLIFSSLTSAGSGFFFWLIADRFYSTEDVGIATALISSMGLIVLLSRFGLEGWVDTD